MNNSTPDSSSIVLGKDDRRIKSESALILKGIVCFEAGDILEAISWFGKTIENATDNSIAYHYRGLCYCLLVELCPDISYQDRENYLNMAKSDFNSLTKQIEIRFGISQRFCDSLIPLNPINPK